MAVYAIMVMIVGVFMLFTLYIFGSVSIFNLFNKTSDITDNTRVTQFQNAYTDMWNSLPYIVIIGILAWAIIYSLRRERHDVYFPT